MRVDSGRNDAARFSNGAGPGRLRVRSLAARGLAVAVFVVFAALLALPVQAETPDAGADAPQFTVSRSETQVARAAGATKGATVGATVVPLDWSLIPDGLGAGDEFRLLFLSSERRNALSAIIGTYNTFIQDLAAVGHADIWAYSSGFKVVGCTYANFARGNANTGYTDSDKGVPIYWLGADRDHKVADDYQDFYDGSWTNEWWNLNEFGSRRRDTSVNINQPFTGCYDNGKGVRGDEPRTLGASRGYTRIGRLSSDSGGPIDGDTNAPSSDLRPFYGLSKVFHVGSPDATLSMLGLQSVEVIGGGRYSRRVRQGVSVV